MKEKNCIDNIILSELNQLDIYDASIEILEKMKFLDRDSHDYKFKEIANQVVVETKDYYYKLYIDYGDYGKYLLEIRNKLADIYQSYGVCWNIISNCNNGRVITIEQREKLKLCDADISCKDLLKDWKHTIEILTNNLKFTDILSQIKSENTLLNTANKLLLLKESLIKPNDYAYAPNGNVILLDDSDFFLGIADENGELLSIEGLNIDVMTTCGLMQFRSQKEYWENRIKGKYDVSKRYFIMDKEYNLQIKDIFTPNDMDTINKELSIFITGKPANMKYKNEYYREYYNNHIIQDKTNSKLS